MRCQRGKGPAAQDAAGSSAAGALADALQVLDSVTGAPEVAYGTRLSHGHTRPVQLVPLLGRRPDALAGGIEAVPAPGDQLHPSLEGAPERDRPHAGTALRTWLAPNTHQHPQRLAAAPQRQHLARNPSGVR